MPPEPARTVRPGSGADRSGAGEVSARAVPGGGLALVAVLVRGSVRALIVTPVRSLIVTPVRSPGLCPVLCPVLCGRGSGVVGGTVNSRE